jgi:hypothetical protein
MRRILAVILMLWLPLIMQSAWAMSAHMALQEDAGHVQQTSPCHHAALKAHPHQRDHHCAHCLACAIVSASASFNHVPSLQLLDSAKEKPSSAIALYFSLHLPTESKPPISA